MPNRITSLRGSEASARQLIAKLEDAGCTILEIHATV
jgi:hypothetical protein